jgi:hypothetical protein
LFNQKATTGNFLSGKREGRGERERGVGRSAGQQVGIFKIEGRDRHTER